jgi:hypothetical protein
MASLTTHLRRPEDHGRLAFHPDCPVCRRERLAGAGPPDALVGHRTQALLAASVFALSSAPATAAIAAEPDQEQEGAISPDQAGAASPVADPQSDPGGSSTELPVDPAPPEAQDQADAGDETTLEQEAAAVGAPAEEPGTADAPEAMEPATIEPVPAPSAPTPAALAPPTAEPPAPTPEPSPTAAPPDAVASEPRPERKPEPVRKTRKRSSVAAPRETVLRFVAPQTPPVDPGWSPPASVEVAHAEPAAAHARPSAGADRDRAARRGERVHVVRTNESLWSIARDLLGDNASAARIAREVNRLWELNSGRIGTGDPDLLIAGTQLRV